MVGASVVHMDGILGASVVYMDGILGVVWCTGGSMVYWGASVLYLDVDGWYIGGGVAYWRPVWCI